MRRLLPALFACFLAFSARAESTLVLWDFDNNTVGTLEAIQGVEHLSRVLPEALLAKLSRTPGLRLVERVRLRELLDEQKLGTSTVADQDARLKLGRILGAGSMIFGEYIALGPVIRVDVRLVDTATSQILLSEPLTGAEEELLADIDNLAGLIARRQGAQYTTGQGGTPFPPQAWALYESGLRQMDEKQFEAAVETFKQLLGQHPGFAPAERQIGLALERLARKH
jgi:TolB-like protein